VIPDLYWGQRERFIAPLEWLAALGNAEGMGEWVMRPVCWPDVCGVITPDKTKVPIEQKVATKVLIRYFIRTGGVL
jgi:hypothetical protein